MKYAKHLSVTSYCQREYIEKGIFDKKYSKYLQEAFQIRNNCDYDDFYIVVKDDAVEQLSRAEEYYNAVKKYLLGI